MAPKVASAAAELRQDAAEARDLASTLKDSASIADLLEYASALESDAAGWEDAPSASVVVLNAGFEREICGSRQGVAEGGERLQRRRRR
jgi:hypothetical protein